MIMGPLPEKSVSYSIYHAGMGYSLEKPFPKKRFYRKL